MLSDGEKLNSLSKVSMDDVGSRMSHLLELYTLWQTGLDILERFDKSSPWYDKKKEELEGAIRLLGYHMEKDYQEKEYREVIDELPAHGEDILNDNPTQ